MTVSTKFMATSVAIAALGLFLASNSSIADQVYNDNLVALGSACVGFDCDKKLINGKVQFGFATILLKEHNLRIFFRRYQQNGEFPQE